MKGIKEFILITVGIILVAAGMHYFLIPNNLAAGGVSGLGIILNYYLGISVGLLMIIMNIVLLIIAFIVIGKDFGGKTIYASVGLSGAVWILEKISPMDKPITGDLMLELIFGILISGAGMALVFYQNASTGGTDIIAKILNKFFHLNIGRALLISDFLITILAGVTFGPKIGMYAVLGVMINSYVIDSAIEGFNICKEVIIISTKVDEIRKFIMDELGRGATVYSAKGAFTNETKEVITTVVDSRQFIRLKVFIQNVDKEAFVTIKNVHEALGEGFERKI